MIKCNYFRKRTDYDYSRGSIVHSAMSEFNNWNQADVESIISIDTCANQNGEIETIVVYYNAKEIDNEG
jgi:hypothetical protein